jgi:hypothetical protein
VAFLFGGNVSKEEIMAAIQDCAQKLGRSPSYEELYQHAYVTHRNINKHFGSYGNAVRACGMERPRGGQPVKMEVLFKDWAGVVRKLGKTPTVIEYQVHSEYSPRPLATRFGSWVNVPLGMLSYAEKEGLTDEWTDVLELVKAQKIKPVKAGERSKPEDNLPSRPKLMSDRPTYGPPMMDAGLAYGPANELGVVFLFGMVARQLGFVVMRIQIAFPDCEAMRKIDDQTWQKVRIEFEYESRNFLRHNHPPSGCDLIVCWIHNWHECPVEVVELGRVAVELRQ